jgi:uncharacterized iron-regulated protein
MSRRGVGAVVGCLLIAGCTGLPPGAVHPTSSTDSQRSPEVDAADLTGTVIIGARPSPLDRGELLARVHRADIVYLGEKHDNPYHHSAQHWVLERLVAAGRRPAIGFEVFDRAQTATLMRFVETKPSDAEGKDARDPAVTRLRARLGWGKHRDSSWAFYGPILELARAHGLRVFGIDLPTSLRARISRVGVDGLSASERSLLPEQSGDVDPDYRALMLERLSAAHCGHGTPEQLAKLFENWTLRNETMARAIGTALDAPAGGAPVVVILGGGHVRGGEGVPRRVARRHAGVSQLNIGLRELPEGTGVEDVVAMSATAHGNQWRTEHEISWFTPASGMTLEAACAMFKHPGPLTKR